MPPGQVTQTMDTWLSDSEGEDSSSAPDSPAQANKMDLDSSDSDYDSDDASDDGSDSGESDRPDSGSGSDGDYDSTPEMPAAFDPTEDLDENGEVILEPASEADLLEVDAEIEHFEEVNGVDPFDEDFELDKLHDGALHPAEHYRMGIAMMDETEFQRKEYARSTEVHIVRAESHWRRYCQVVLHKSDPVKCIQELTFNVVYFFLKWYLDLRANKNGQRKPPVKSRQSLTTFWCNFRIAVERAVNMKVNKLIDISLVRNGLAKLGKIYNLKTDKRANREMSIKSLKRQIKTTLSTPNKCFRLGELRILAALFLLLMAPAGSRPESVLKLRFKHLRLSLNRDPEDPNGHPRLLIQLRLEFTKQYLGSKATKTFPIPEILYDPSLFLSPHVFILAILSRHQAFLSDDLNEDLGILDTMPIPAGDDESEIALKPDILDKFVFRRAARDFSGGYSISDQPITQGMMTEWIATVGKLAGFGHQTIAYNLRYGAANSMERGSVSDAMRNLAMDHAPNSDTFAKNYLSRNFCADLMAIHRGLPAQQALIYQAVSHGGNVSSRRPTTLTHEQVEALKQDRQWQHLNRRLSDFPMRSEMHAKIRRERNARLQRLKTRKLSQVREEWGKEQGVKDIRRHIQGHDITVSASPAQNLPPHQQEMMDALSAPLINDYEAVIRRRTAAINALVAYCTVEEPITRKVIKTAAELPMPAELSLGRTGNEALEMIKRSTMTAHAGKDVRRCYVCVAKAETLGGQDHPRFPELCQQFARQGTLARHFIQKHLDNLQDDDPSVCPICKVTLLHKKHLQNHSQRYHGINTNITFKRPENRRRY